MPNTEKNTAPTDADKLVAQAEAQANQDLDKYKSAIADANKACQTASCVAEQAGPSWWTPKDAMTMCSAVLVFGLLAFVLTIRALRDKENHETVLRAIGLVLIIFAALFLLVAGYSDRQVAPLYGLLGTIAGYIFGKEKPQRSGADNAAGSGGADGKVEKA